MLALKDVPVTRTKTVLGDDEADPGAYWCMVLAPGTIQAMFRWPDRLLTYLDANGIGNDVARIRITTEGVELVETMTNDEFRALNF